MSNTITVNGVEYIRADSVPAVKPNGNRAVIVVDRGWIMDMAMVMAMVMAMEIEP